MLTAKALNEDSTLNNFSESQTVTVSAGSDSTVVIRLHDLQKNLRYIPVTGATLAVVLLNSDGTTVSPAITNPFLDDRSIWSFAISAAQSALLISQDLKLTLTEGAKTTAINVRRGFSISGGDCC